MTLPLITLLRQCFSGFLTVVFSCSTLPLDSLGRTVTFGAHRWVESYAEISWVCSVDINYLEFLFTWDFSLLYFLKLISYFCQYTQMNIYFGKYCFCFNWYRHMVFIFYAVHVVDYIWFSNIKPALCNFNKSNLYVM